MPDLFAPGAAETLLLLALRIGGMVLIAPVFSARTVPVVLRTSLLVLLAVLLFPAAYAHAETGVVELSPTTAFAETLIGMAIGLGVALLVGAAEIMGDLLAIHTGLSGAASLDPLTNVHTPTLGQFAHLFAVTLLLSLGAHLGMLEVMAGTLEMLPVGGAVDMEAGLEAMVSVFATLFALGAQLAMPVVAVISLANVALAILSRVAPQLNVLALAFPVQIGLGLFALAAALPLIANTMGGWAAMYDGILGQTLGALGGSEGP